IKINPKKKVRIEGRRPTDDFHLGYTDADLANEQVFSYKYKKIKNLLENSNVIVVGHSVDSDSRFLQNACRDSKLRYIRFKALDIQKIFKVLNKTSQDSSLKNIGIELGVDFKEESHTGLSGAFLTMECFKALHNKIGFDPVTMLDDDKYAVKSVTQKKNKKERKARFNYTIGELMFNNYEDSMSEA
ncbi:MAG: hypothetical protein IJZ73_05345, partial [Clostridia bacterium]|nr:hypothetical protein [Clostridia bacterium]